MHIAITGASSGIGESLARAAAQAGHKLSLIARRRELLEKLNDETGGNAFIAAQDLSDTVRATDWIGAAEAKHGPIDALINNAGMENVGLTATSDPETGVKLIALNLVTPILITRALLPKMIVRRSGSLVQVASVAALSPPPGQSWYGASKAGLAMFCETLRSELKGTGVHAMCVYPGPITTPMGEAAYAKYGGREGPAGRAPEGKPEILAQRILDGIAARQARVIYPRFYTLSYLFPWLARAVGHAMSPLPK